MPAGAVGGVDGAAPEFLQRAARVTEFRWALGCNAGDPGQVVAGMRWPSLIPLLPSSAVAQ